MHIFCLLLGPCLREEFSHHSTFKGLIQRARLFQDFWLLAMRCCSFDLFFLAGFLFKLCSSFWLCAPNFFYYGFWILRLGCVQDTFFWFGFSFSFSCVSLCFLVIYGHFSPFSLVPLFFHSIPIFFSMIYGCFYLFIYCCFCFTYYYISTLVIFCCSQGWAKKTNWTEIATKPSWDRPG